ncbi:MAG TPA: MBL fold metallo-hydrolase [Nocardioides sp.]|nr:MBL fold metallo-hydrolase [Nocardioides sp.]
MILDLLGVRGSTAAPGAGFVRYGGHTSCVAVSEPGAPPTLVLDAGTGLRDLGTLLDGRPFRGDVVLTHLHWDHVQGLPFSGAVDHPESRVRLHVPVPDAGTDPLRLLRRAMSPPHFPIGPDELLGDWQLVPLVPGPVRLADERFAVEARRVRHKGGPAYGLRVTGPAGGTAAYLPDHLLLDGGTDGAEVAADADLLLHDGQFVAAEEQLATAYGHSTVPAALEYADHCRVGRVVLTHHHPDRTDDALDALATAFPTTPGGRAVCFAAQGGRWVVEPPS